MTLRELPAAASNVYTPHEQRYRDATGGEPCSTVRLVNGAASAADAVRQDIGAHDVSGAGRVRRLP